VTNGREKDLIREEQIAKVCVQSNFMELNDDTIYDTSQDGRFYRPYRIVAPSITRHCFLPDELPGKTDFQSILLPSGDLYARRFPF